MILNSNNEIEELKHCVCCGGTNLITALDLHEQPLANSCLEGKNDPEPVYPLKLNFCTDCTHLQLSHVVHPDLLFKNYLYVSGTSQTLRDYFDWFVGLTEKYIVKTNKNVLDIACNDGTQLKSFKNKGYNTFGIDPATNLYERSSKDSTVICDYLTKESLEQLGKTYDVIIAQNVFAHNDYPEQFLLNCKDYLNNSGCMFIQTSQADMVKNNEYDSIYHEHLSFFSVKSFCTLARRCGYNVIDVIRTPIHGTSFVFVLSNVGIDESEFFILREEELNTDIIKQYAEKCHIATKNFVEKLKELREQGYKIIGYGAAAKGNTVLNYAHLTSYYIDYIVDDNPLKHGLYTPGSRIKIVSPDILKTETNKLCVVPLAWNFFDEIRKNVLKLKNDNIIFLKYFPEISVHE